MPKTLEQIRDGLVEADKKYVGDLEMVAYYQRVGLADAATARWDKLPATFRARYAGIDAEGNLTPTRAEIDRQLTALDVAAGLAPDPVLTQVLSVLHPADRAHAETATKVVAMYREGRSADGDKAEMALPTDARLRYRVEGGQLIRCNAKGRWWTDFLAAHPEAPVAEFKTAPLILTTDAPAVLNWVMPDGRVVPMETAALTVPAARALLEKHAATVKVPEAATVPSDTTAPKETTMSDKPETKKFDVTATVANEMQAAAWEAGVEVVIEDGRDLIASLLTDGMEPAEAETAKVLFLKAFRGRFGVPFVAGSLGALQLAAQSGGLDLPLLAPATTHRLGSEMRKLAMRSSLKSFYGVGRELLAKHGGRLMASVATLGQIAERTNVRVDALETTAKAADAYAPPPGAADAAKRANGALS